MRHTIIISPNETEISNSAWTKNAKPTVTAKLSNIQVKNLIVTKKGNYLLDLPHQINQDKAKEQLINEFHLTAETKVVGLIPKITLCDLDLLTYGSKDKDALKTDILAKNPEILNLVEKQKNL